MTTKPNTYVGMGGMAAMGWSMGGAIGAKLGRPDHLVVHLLGDASFGMTGMEVETAVRMGLPTLTILINNGGIGGGVMGMNRPAGTSSEVAKLGGNFSLVAQGLGAYSERGAARRPDPRLSARHPRHRRRAGGALVVMIKPMRTPELPDDWAL